MISTSLFRFECPFGAHRETISAGAGLVVPPTLLVFLLLQRLINNVRVRVGDEAGHVRRTAAG